MENFDALSLPQPLLLALRKMQFSKPTPIQAQAIPMALDGRDILGSAQTGTGKTAAFAIPMIAHLINNPNSGAIVMTPTRELATQVADAVSKMLDGSGQIKLALLIGGQSMGKQLQQLRNRARIIIGTPGRINDHLQQGSLKLYATDFLVLDETDRMLDMGFEVQIDRIVRKLPDQRQTLLFSATLPDRIVKMSEKYLSRPERIAVGSTHTPIDRIKQELIHLPTAEKYNNLLGQLKNRTGSVIVFVRTKRGADRLAEKLNKEQHSAEAIHGNLSQNQRNRVIQAFRDKKHRVMVATDVAARGLDIPHIEHVINYDLPQCPEDYIHRIGRTARAGAEGEAVCFISPEESDLWREIHFLMHPNEKPERRPSAGRASGKKSFSKPRGDRKPFDRNSKPRRFEEGRPARAERGDRPARSERPEYSARGDRPQRNDRNDRFERNDRSHDRNERSEQRQPRRSDRFDRNDPFARSDRFDRANREDRGSEGKRNRNNSDRPQRAAAGDRNDAPPKKRLSQGARSDRNKAARRERGAEVAGGKKRFHSGNRHNAA